MESISLKPLSPNEIYTSSQLEDAPLQTASPLKQQEGANHVQAVTHGEHTFALPEANHQDIEVTGSNLTTPHKPMPFEGVRQNHAVDQNSLGLPLNHRPQADQDNLTNLANNLGQYGQDVVKALLDTHSMQTRLVINDEPLSTPELERLTHTATELVHDLEEGIITPDSLLTRANARQFKLTSIKDMTEILSKTNNKINALTMDMGYGQDVKALQETIQKRIGKAEANIIGLLKKCKPDLTQANLKDIMTPPQSLQDDFDSSRFLNSLSGLLDPGNELQQREALSLLGHEIFTLHQDKIRLEQAVDKLQDARQKLLGIKENTHLEIIPQAQLKDDENATQALKIALKTVKRLRHAVAHPDEDLALAHQEAFTELFKTMNEISEPVQKVAGQPKAGNKEFARILHGNIGTKADVQTRLEQFSQALDFQSQTLQATCHQLQFALAQPARQELLQNQLKAIAGLHNTGGNRSVNGTVALNIPGEALGIPVSNGLALSYSYVIDVPHGGGAISAAHVKGFTVTLSAGPKKVCTVDVTGGFMSSKAKLFTTPEAFVEHNTNKMLTAILLKRSFMFQKPKTMSYDKQQWIAITNNQLLLQRLGLLGTLQTGDELDTSDLKTTKSLYNEVKTHTKLLKGDLNIGDKVFHNGTTVSKSTTRMTLNSNIFQSLEMDPRLFAKQKHQYFMNETTDLGAGAPDPYKQLEKLKQKIEKAQKADDHAQLEALNKELFHAMDCLDAEFQTYTNVVNDYENKTSRHSRLVNKIRRFFRISDPSSLEGKLLDLKTTFEKGRSSRNRGEYIRAVMFTHAQLKNLYDQTVQGLQDNPPANATREQLDFQDKRLEVQAEQVEKFKNDYLNPQMHLDHKRHVQRFLAIHKTSKIITTSVENATNAALPAGIPAEVGAKITYKDVSQHHFLSQKAESIVLDFTLNTKNLNLFPATLNAIAGHYNDNSLPVETMLGVTRDFVAKAASEAGKDITLLQRSAGIHFQLNLIKGPDHKYHYQVFNISSEAKLNAGTQFPILNVAGGTSQSNIIAQFIGANSINYPLTKYIFTRSPGKPMPQQWDDFLDRNLKNIRKILGKVAVEGSNPNQEIRAYFEAVPGAEQDFETFMNAHQAELADVSRLRDFQVKDIMEELCQTLAGFETQYSAGILKDKN